MKKFLTITIIIAIIIGGTWIYNYRSNNQNDSGNYEAERTSTAQENNETENNTQSEEKKDEETQKQAEAQAKASEEQAQAETQATEEQAQAEASQAQQAPVEAKEIASFTTKIYTKDSSRQNNISITCSALNNTDVANAETFSFCNTVGRASPKKGYEKADIFNDGQKTKGYGGGNCQVSTTLYNAVLKAPNLKVTERHEHSNKVPYIQTGKDAAVAYGTYDFKFVNTTGSPIRIKASNTANSVSISLIQLI